MRILRVRVIDRPKLIHHLRVLNLGVRPRRLRLKPLPSLHRRIPRRHARPLHPGPRRRRAHAHTAQHHQSHRAQPAAAPAIPALTKQTHTSLQCRFLPSPPHVNPPKVLTRIPSIRTLPLSFFCHSHRESAVPRARTNPTPATPPPPQQPTPAPHPAPRHRSHRPPRDPAVHPPYRRPSPQSVQQSSLPARASSGPY